MTKLAITNTKYWTDANGAKVKQIEYMICTVTKEDANWVWFDVDAIDSVENAAPFYGATRGGALLKRFLNNYEGRVGTMTVALA